MMVARWYGILALACAAAAYDVLLAAVRRADKAFPSTLPADSTWWFGYARDLANAAGAAMYAGSFVILGYPGPIALLCGVVLMVVTYALDYGFGRGLSVRRTELALAAALAVVLTAVVALSAPILSGTRELLGWLFR